MNTLLKKLVDERTITRRGRQKEQESSGLAIVTVIGLVVLFQALAQML
jgi:hypothetical protein